MFGRTQAFLTMTQTRLDSALLLVGPLFVLLGGCGSQETTSSEPANVTARSQPSLGMPRWEAQEGWVEQSPQSAMRLLEYRLEGEGEPVLVVSHWPNGVGGLEPNLDRWRGSVVGPDPCEVVTTFPNELRVDLISGYGMVSDGMGGEASEGALLAAYIQSPEGRFPGVYTVKVIGAQATLDAHRSRVEAFLAQL